MMVNCLLTKWLWSDQKSSIIESSLKQIEMHVSVLKATASRALIRYL